MTVRPRKDVLIVDDDESFRNLVCTSLTAAGLTCSTAVDGLEALEQLKAMTFAVLLLDLNMPRLDGPGVLEAIRSRELDEAERPVVLVMTASSEREALLAHSDLVQFVIRKPLNVRDLVQLVQDCVSGQSRDREA